MWQPPECETLDELARVMHEYYVSLIREGFTQHEALHMALGQGCCLRQD